ncbi:Beta-glucosidase [termite gut metagenome]|uniref:Beta-glucosidase n=1 Tax=termite gut metagenome TaxID=433724 RepID=A0A5J4S0H2_9ZZZZ
MIKKFIFGTVLTGILFSCNTNKTPQLGKSSIDDVVKAMTLEEKAKLLIGTGMDLSVLGDSAVVGETDLYVQGAAGTTYPIPRLGIPTIVVADGPAGLRIAPLREGTTDTYYCTAFPVATLLASTWNTDLVESVGKAMGNEVLEYGVDILLAPALNTQRNPLCGRNFEYYSEDPVVSGKIAAAMVRGIQSNGVGTSIKHFAANNQETNRMGNDSRISQRALREIYLKGYEIAVKESDPWTVMTSYNYINGTYSSESKELLQTILRDEWGFKGIVMTDWFGGKNAASQVIAGNDLLMPGSKKQCQNIIDAVNDGSLPIEAVDTNVKRILNLILESPRYKGYAYTDKPDLKAHAEVSRQSATEGIILLKNNNTTLPLIDPVKSVAPFGITSYDFIAGGTGSGDVNRAYTVSLTEGLKNAGYQLNTDLVALYDKYISEENEKNKSNPVNPLLNFLPKKRLAEFIPSAASLKNAAASADVALITIGRTSGEFIDRKLPNDYELSENEQKLIREVTGAFHAVNKRVVVILNIGGVVETASWKNTPDAILLAWQLGQEGGNSVADVLSGKVNPSGKLPMTFPVKYTDVASSANFPQDNALDLDINSILGLNKDPDRELVRNVDYTNYEEDIFVGYRYFDSFGKQVSYPFGYGLSYTTFELSNPTVKEENGAFTLTVDVKNTGSFAGKEVVQLYVSAPVIPAYSKPEKELKAFAKTKELQPNETQTITLTVTAADLASFDPNASAWVTDSGKYLFLLGTSSKDIKVSVDTTINKKLEVKTNNVLSLQSPINILKR